jgi:ABC-type lipoprotein release transport system permease subunit
VGPVSYLVRRDLMRRWRSALFFALLVALGAGTTLAALAGARRNATAFDRLLAPSRAADVMALPNEPGFDWDAVRALPEVEALAPFAVSGYTAQGFPGDGIAFPAVTDDMYTTVERGILTKGRYFDHSRPDEVMVSPGAKKVGYDVGDHVKLRTAAPDQLDDIDSLTFADARGPEVDATIVGVLVTPFGATYNVDNGAIFTTSAFYETYKENILPADYGYENALVRLEHGPADEAAFQHDIDELAGHGVDLTLFSSARKNVTRSTDFEAKSLYAFAVVAATASVVLIGLALGRMVLFLGSDLETLGALGLTRRRRARVGAGTPAIAGVIGVVLGAVGAWLVSSRFPIGVGRRVEPFPGRTFNAALLLGGGLLIALVIVAASLLVAARQRARAPHPERRSIIGRATANAPLPVALGTRLALERGQGRSAVPVRPALIGAIVGVLGVVGVATFRNGLDSASMDEFGQHYDIATGTIGAFPLPDNVVPDIAADRDVEMVLDAPIAVVDFGASSVTVLGPTAVKGDYGLTVLAGREPVSADEIALSPRDRDRLHVDVGDTIRSNGQAFEVVGIALMPSAIHTDFDEGGWMTGDGLARVATPEDWKFRLVYVRLRDAADQRTVEQRLAETTGTGFEDATPPTALYNLKTIRTVPLTLAVFLAILAVGAVGHALATAVRRRRAEMAVIRSLGMTRGQARWSVVVQATTLAGVGILVGIPLGIVAGQFVWRSLADAVPFVYERPWALTAIVLAQMLAIVISNLLAAVPARRAARLAPAEVLRAE